MFSYGGKEQIPFVLSVGRDEIIAGECIVGIDVEKDIKLWGLLCEGQRQLRMSSYTDKAIFRGSLSHNAISEHSNFKYIYVYIHLLIFFHTTGPLYISGF